MKLELYHAYQAFQFSFEKPDLLSCHQYHFVKTQWFSNQQSKTSRLAEGQFLLYSRINRHTTDQMIPYIDLILDQTSLISIPYIRLNFITALIHVTSMLETLQPPPGVENDLWVLAVLNCSGLTAILICYRRKVHEMCTRKAFYTHIVCGFAPTYFYVICGFRSPLWTAGDFCCDFKVCLKT